MGRSEFKASVKLAAWNRCKGFCEGCGAKLYPGRFAYDHKMPDGLGGEPTLENCQVLCTACHHTKTVEVDRPPMQKADNIRSKHLNIKEKKGWWKPPGYVHRWGNR